MYMFITDNTFRKKQRWMGFTRDTNSHIVIRGIRFTEGPTTDGVFYSSVSRAGMFGPLRHRLAEVAEAGAETGERQFLAAGVQIFLLLRGNDVLYPEHGLKRVPHVPQKLDPEKPGRGGEG